MLFSILKQCYHFKQLETCRTQNLTYDKGTLSQRSLDFSFSYLESTGSGDSEVTAFSFHQEVNLTFCQVSIQATEAGLHPSIYVKFGFKWPNITKIKISRVDNTKAKGKIPFASAKYAAYRQILINSQHAEILFHLEVS